MRISDWSSDVCSSDLSPVRPPHRHAKTGAKMTKREKIGEGDDARYVRRDDEGKFTEDQVDVGRSSAADQRRDAENDTKPGQGDKGDRKRDRKSTRLNSSH